MNGQAVKFDWLTAEALISTSETPHHSDKDHSMDLLKISEPYGLGDIGAAMFWQEKKTRGKAEWSDGLMLA